MAILSGPVSGQGVRVGPDGEGVEAAFINGNSAFQDERAGGHTSDPDNEMMIAHSFHF